MQITRDSAKAYLLGTYLGDGCVANPNGQTKDKRTRFILVGVDLDTQNRTRICIERIYPHLSGRIKICHERDTKAGTPYYRMDVNDESFSSFLLKLTGDRKNYFPKEKWLYEPSTLREFTAGLMDTDGYIEHSFIRRNGIPRWLIGFTSTSKWLSDLRNIFIKNGVKVGGFHTVAQIPNMPTQDPNNWNTPYRINMNIQTFIDAGFYFCALRKCARVQLRNWWAEHGIGSGAHGRSNEMQERQALLLGEFVQEKLRVELELKTNAQNLYKNLMESGILYRRAKNPQRPEASPLIKQLNKGDVRVQLRGKPGRRTVPDF